MSKKIFFFLLLAGMFFPGWARAGAGEIRWVSYPEGITRAAQADRPALVLFYSRSCRVCGVLEKKVFSNPEIAGYINASLIPIRVDISRAEDLVKRYRIFGSPTIYFLKSDSTPIDFIAGYVEPGKFSNIIHYVGDGNYGKMTYNEYLREKKK